MSEMQFTPLLKLNEDKNKFVIDTKFYNDDKVYNGDCAGVYIWGFLHPNDSKKFIPYYVGMTGAKTIFETIISRHIKPFNTQNSTYRRMTTNYLFGLNGIPPFYKDPKFPLYTNSVQENEWLDNIKDKLGQYLFYLHNPFFFKLIDPKLSNKEDKDIATQFKHLPTKWKNKYSSTDFFVKENIENFRFIYWNINEGAFNRQPDMSTTIYMKIFETITKFSLAGKTSGLSSSPQTLAKRMYNLGISRPSLNSIDANLNYIFRKSDSLVYHSKEELKTAYDDK